MWQKYQTVIINGGIQNAIGCEHIHCRHAAIVANLHNSVVVQNHHVAASFLCADFIGISSIDAFTQQTGIRVNLLTANSDSLFTRLEREGRNSPADLLITVDVGRLHLAKSSNLTQPLNSELVHTLVPDNYRDIDDHWVGLSLRARPIMYARGRVSIKELSNYDDLVNAKWRGRICSRSSSNVYNQSLVASMLAANGEKATLEWIQGMVGNLAKPPSGGGTQQIQSIAAGECDIALVNTYYLGLMATSRDKKLRAAAKRVAIHWPDQEGRGVHVNISGAAISRHAKNKDNAVKLIEFLLGDEAQESFSSSNFEYPVTELQTQNKTLKKWGSFNADSVALHSLGPLVPDAVKLMSRGQWR